MVIFRAIAVVVLFSLPTAQAWSADGNEPASLPASRYAAMREKSPFALATPPELVATPQASFAANWFVGGIGRYGDSDFVTIKSRDQSVQFTLFGHEMNTDHGVTVSSVNWTDEIGQSTVILQKGTETAKLEFNQALLRGPQATAGAPQSPIPGAPSTAATTPGGAPRLTKAVTMPVAPTNGAAPIIVPSQAGRQSPTAARNPGIVQRRVQIIAQPR